MAQGTSCEFVIEAPKIARKAEPGQFIILRANETGERIPLTIAHADREKGTIAIIFQVVGKTTALLNTFRAGDSLPDVMGPLGKPTHIENLGQVICVGGGTGVAVMYPITRAFKEAGNHVIAIIGARNKELLILENEMKAASHELYVTTDDGSYGHHGFVTDVLKQILDRDKKTNEVIGIGPVPMMKAVANVTKPYGVKTTVSLNSIMVDATGMCGGCRVTVGGKSRFTCVDGPDFDGHLVDFDELTKRHRAYRAHEQNAMEKFKCKITGQACSHG